MDEHAFRSGEGLGPGRQKERLGLMRVNICYWIQKINGEKRTRRTQRWHTSSGSLWSLVTVMKGVLDLDFAPFKM